MNFSAFARKTTWRALSARLVTKLLSCRPPDLNQATAAVRAFGSLLIWNRQHRQGRVLESSVGYTLPDGSVLSPDASWVSPERLATVTPEQLQKFPALCPDFVIEIKSPSDRIPTLQAKMEQWLRNGVRLGFLIDTEAETSYVYAAGQPMQTVQGFGNELSGEPVLPGFRLDLRELKG
jgi:Uma2 family endonuclease